MRKEEAFLIGIKIFIEISLYQELAGILLYLIMIGI